MKSTIFSILISLIGISCDSAKGQQNETPTPFSVHSEIVPREITTAKNVTVGNRGVTAFFAESETEITLNYCGSALIEYREKAPEMYSANVFQLQTGVWIAEIAGGQYMLVHAETGTAQVDLGGEFCVFMP